MFNIHDRYWFFTHSLNEHIYLLASKYILIIRFKMHSEGKVFKIVGVCFKVKYLIMTIQSLSSTFKHNIFSTKSLANAPLINLNWFFYPQIHVIQFKVLKLGLHVGVTGVKLDVLPAVARLQGSLVVLHFHVALDLCQL